LEVGQVEIFIIFWRAEMYDQNRVVFVAALATSILLSACSSTPVAPPVIAKPPPPVVSVTPSAPSQVANKPAVPAVVVATPLAPYLDPQNPLYKQRSVYFDFDQAAVKPEATPLIELHGKFLATHPAVSIKIEGNTDEQGGAEYNLALGQKRAEAVLRTLKIYGVKDSQMEAVSFGEEKPKALGHDETAFVQNRRADLDYPAK
jgi:peptidoglycan-associated lipoprotein